MYGFLIYTSPKANNLFGFAVNMQEPVSASNLSAYHYQTWVEEMKATLNTISDRVLVKVIVVEE